MVGRSMAWRRSRRRAARSRARSGASFIARPSFRCRRWRSRRSSVRRPASCSASQRVDPGVLRKHQFAFDFPTLDAALEDVLAAGQPCAISPAQSRPEGARRRALRAADPDGDRCAAQPDVRLLLEGREPRRDHAGCDASFHSGTAAADGRGDRDRLSRARRAPARWLGKAHHHVGAGPMLCGSLGEGPVSLLVARTHISVRRRAHRDGGSRVLHAAARARRAAGEWNLHRLDPQEIFQYRGDVIRLRFGVVA